MSSFPSENTLPCSFSFDKVTRNKDITVTVSRYHLKAQKVVCIFELYSLSQQHADNIRAAELHEQWHSHAYSKAASATYAADVNHHNHKPVIFVGCMRLCKQFVLHLQQSILTSALMLQGFPHELLAHLRSHLLLNVIQHLPLSLNQHGHVQEDLVQVHQARLQVLHCLMPLLDLSHSIQCLHTHNPHQKKYSTDFCQPTRLITGHQSWQ